MPIGSQPDYNSYDFPASVVDQQLTVMGARADEAITNAQLIIDKLKNTDLESVPTPPAAPDGNVGVPNIPAFSGTAPDPNLFGTIDDPNMPLDPGDVLTGIDFSGITIPEFTETVTLDLPLKPSPINVTAPVSPTLGPVSIPAAPTLSIPAPPTLEDMNLPAFTFPTLPTFTEDAPTFTATAPDVTPNYTEPTYTSGNLDAVQGEIAAMMAGGSGMPPAVEAAIFARAVERADNRGNIEVQQAFNDYAGRGFDMPPGMLNAQVDAAREQQKEQVAGARRDIFIQAAEWQREALQFAVQQGMALEQLLMGQFNSMADRALQMAQLQQQGEIALYNAEVSLFNARQGAYEVQARVFRVKLDAALSTLEVYRAKLEGQKLIGDINENMIRSYQTQIEAVRANVDLYNARLQGAETQTRVQSNQIDAYRAEVQAYGDKISAEKVRFDAYEAELRGESTKVDIYESQARAFAATVEAQRGKVNLKAEEVRAKLGQAQATTERYTAKVQAQRDFIAAQATAMQAQAQAYASEVQRYTAEIDADRSLKQLQETVIQNKIRNNLAFFQTQMGEYDALMARQIQQAQLNISAVTAAGEMTSQLAAGAMSAVSVGASVSASGNQSTSSSWSESHYYDETPLA